jgi:peptidoglycan hydrolase CwlO-like protein
MPNKEKVNEKIKSLSELIDFENQNIKKYAHILTGFEKRATKRIEGYKKRLLSLKQVEIHC